LKENHRQETLKAREALARGELVLIFDRADRECEVDLCVAAEHITPAIIHTLRRDGGGLICVCTHPTIAKELDLPFLTEVFEYAWNRYPVLKELQAHDIPYGERSSFSLTINHRKTFTGITDQDRALTIQEFVKLARELKDGKSPEEARKSFGKNFRSPGHVFLLKGAEGLLKNRSGHTELSLALLEPIESMTSVAVICEMMNGRTGKAVSYEDANKYAKKNNLQMISGDVIVKAYINAPGKEKTK